MIGEIMIKAVIFDMDGVVVDTGLVHNIAEQKILKDIGIDISLEEIRKYAGIAASIWFKEILKKYNKVADAEKLEKKKFKMVYNSLEKNVPFVPGALELIGLLKKNKIKIALASGSPKDFVNYIVSKSSLNKKFDVVIGLGDYSNSKPDPEIFLLASKEINIKPKDCVVIEDANHGVLAAKKAGMKCIGFVNENSGNQNLSKADLIVDNLEEITIDTIKNL